MRVATEEALIGLDLSYHAHVREALRGATITSDIYLAEPQVASEPTIAFLDPVRGTDGKTVGTAVLWVRASALWDVMKTSNDLWLSHRVSLRFLDSRRYLLQSRFNLPSYDLLGDRCKAEQDRIKAIAARDAIPLH